MSAEAWVAAVIGTLTLLAMGIAAQVAIHVQLATAVEQLKAIRGDLDRHVLDQGKQWDVIGDHDRRITRLEATGICREV